MKIHVISDTHTEFAPYDFSPSGADVVVLAGDIGKGVKGVQWAAAVEAPVVYVSGNHECYKEAVPRIFEKISDAAAQTSKVNYLDNRSIVIHGVRFLGCTLWTDFDLFGTQNRVASMMEAGKVMNDYRLIRKNPQYHRLTPNDTRALHHASRNWLVSELDKNFDGKTVVVTHHAPSARSIEPRYCNDLISAAYASDLEWMMEKYDISLWVHGHTHFCVDYHVGKTRVVSNQRGYPDQDTYGFSDVFCVDI